jgi:hypothetical protein
MSHFEILYRKADTKSKWQSLVLHCPLKDEHRRYELLPPLRGQRTILNTSRHTA